MSVSDILTSALSGLSAAQAGQRTVANNIANVNTPGYSRQRVSLEPGVSGGGQIFGVVIGETERVVDRFLEGAVITRAGDAGRAEVNASYLDRLQSYFGANGAESGMSARIDALASSAQALTAASGGTQTNIAFVGTVTDAIDSLQQLAGDTDGLRADVESEVGASITRINSLLMSVSDLNDTIASMAGLSRTTAAPEDQRGAVLQELGGLIGITTRSQPDGRIEIDTSNGIPLLDQRLRQLDYSGSKVGISQPIYQAIEVRFADRQGRIGAATGQALDSPSIGGKLGGLLDLRDRQLPAFSERLGSLYGGLAQTLNAAANANTAVPAPATLDGRATALAATDRLGFTGAATFAVTRKDGTLVASTRVDFSALGASATVGDAIAAINAGLGSAGSASFVAGKLTIAASGAGTGVVVAQDEGSPSARAGVGFSQYFGLNDLVRSDSSALVPSGFAAADAHGFAAGQGVEIALRDPLGNLMSRYTLTGSGGSTYGDLVDELNASPLSRGGSFALDANGRLDFTPVSGNIGASLSVLSDSTERAGTGRRFASIVGLTGGASDLATAAVRPDLAADPSKLPLARLQNVAIGQKALGSGDRRGASGYVDMLAGTADFGREGASSIARFTATILGETGAAAARANDKMVEFTTRRDDAIARRDSVSGVNIEEELAQMVVLQNSYAAAARVVTTATDMYDTLLAMIR
ncbi:FlgK family flagellar hook-associated protein [Sphingomonas sp. Tas61C01]|uniref:FlgK family flagellar hook-associated protein n=1 Tax=Sphingomonas sp. Tas61C01 TaxID=3458297 RepID=UPI00403E70E4